LHSSSEKKYEQVEVPTLATIAVNGVGRVEQKE
jgi:hypothetical protein